MIDRVGVQALVGAEALIFGILVRPSKAGAEAVAISRQRHGAQHTRA